MTNLSYITNDYARGYVASRSNSRKGVHVPLAYIDICNDNMHDAILFSQIMYWHEPSAENGQTRLRRVHDEHLWIAKNHDDWYSECRVKKRTARTCLERLKKIGLIYYELHGEAGKKTPYIRVNWDKFAELMQAWEAKQSPKNVVQLHDTTGHPPDTTGQGGLSSQDIPLTQQVKPNTEITTENTNKDDDARAREATPPSDEIEQSDLDRVEALLDELDLFKGSRYKDRKLFHSDFADYSTDDWLAGIETFKREIARKLAEQGDEYTPLPYRYLETCVSGQVTKRKQLAVIEKETKPKTKTVYTLDEPLKRKQVDSDMIVFGTGESA